MDINKNRIDEYLEWLKTKLKIDNDSKHFTNYDVKRGQVYHCFFGKNVGSEQEKRRPCVILQNDTGNHFSRNVIVAPITHADKVINVVVPVENRFDSSKKLILDGYVLLGNIITVNKARLDGFITTLSKDEMDSVDIALAKSIDLFRKYDTIIKNNEKHIQNLRNKINPKDLEIAELKKQLEELREENSKLLNIKE